MPQSRAQKRGSPVASSGSPYEDLVCFNLYRGWRSILEFYSPAFPEGYSPQRGYVVGLCMKKPATISEIAAALQIDDASVSNMVRRMESDGLLRKVRSQEDGRSVKVLATDRAIRIELQARRDLAELDAQLTQEITPRQAQALREIASALQRMTHRRR